MRKRIIVAAIIVVVLAVLGVGGWWLWTEYGDRLTPEEGGLAASGTVEADEIAVSSVVAAPIVEVLAEEGAEITSGTILFELDDQLLQLQVDQASASLAAASAMLEQVRADAGTQQEIAQAQARVDQSEAAVRMAEVQAGYAQVMAVADGVVTQVTASAGENASPGKTLAVLTDLSRLWVTVYIPETRIGEVSLGSRASVTTDSSERTFDGEVVYIASEAEFTPANIETQEQRVKLVYEVRLEVDNIGDELKPGMPADVEF